MLYNVTIERDSQIALHLDKTSASQLNASFFVQIVKKLVSSGRSQSFGIRNYIDTIA
jgi:hypothetical protein